MKKSICIIAVCVCSFSVSAIVTISNVSAVQQPGTKNVLITYDVASTAANQVNVSLAVSFNGQNVPVVGVGFDDDIGPGVATGNGKTINWSSGMDWPDNVAELLFTLTADDGDPQPVDAPCPVTQTGQSVSYSPGDDGALQTGQAWPDPRFTNNGDGTVTDHLTGLEWAQAPVDHAGVDLSTALFQCNALVLGGHDDWRLPTRKELLTLIDYSRSFPALPPGHPFDLQTTGYYFWTSTAYSSDWLEDADAWTVNLIDGCPKAYPESHMYFYWAVRKPENVDPAVPKTGQTVSLYTGDDGDLQPGADWPTPRFIDNQDGTIIDNLTGLEWVQNPQGLPGNAANQLWTNAVDFCNNLNYAGHDDWRLPNAREMESILRCGQGTWGEGPFDWFNSSATPFSGLTNDHYWTSTTYHKETNHAWYAYLGDGFMDNDNAKNISNFVWPVRTRQAVEDTWTASVTNSVDTRDYTVAVHFRQGPLATTGEVFTYAWQSSPEFTAAAILDVSGTNYACTGWTGSGAIPASGETNATGSILLTVTNSAITWLWDFSDLDGDGLPDYWESAFFGNITNASAGADTDADRFNNFEEYTAGTNPTNSSSRLWLWTAVRESGFELQWDGVSGRTYTVQSESQLDNEGWQAITNLPGTDGEMSALDTDAESNRFYRLTVERE